MKRKKNLLNAVAALALLMAFAMAARAQTLTYNWSFTTGSSGTEEVNSVATDEEGNVYSTGRFSGTVDFDPGTGQVLRTSSGYTDIFLTKMDPNGNLVWVQIYGGAGNDEGRVVKTDTNGYVYLAAKFAGNIDMDPGTDTVILREVPYIYNGNNVMAGDACLVKLSSSGALQWARSFGLPGYDYPNDLTMDPNGNMIMVGKCGLDVQSLDSFDVDQGSGTTWFYNGGGFIVKYNPNGQYQWAYEMGTAWGGSSPPWRYLYNIEIKGVVADGSKLMLTGYFCRTVDFNPKSGVNQVTALNGSSTTYQDGFIAYYDLNMNFSSVSTFGGTSAICNLNSITLDPSGNLLLAGTHTGTIDYDPTSGVVNLTAAGTTGRSDAVILKIRKAGTLAWARLMGGSNTDAALCVTTDGAGDVYSTGYFNGTADFNPASAKTYNLKSSGLADIFISKLSATGNFVWARKLGGTSDDWGRSLALYPNGNIQVYTGGYYQGTCDFNQESGVDSRTSNGSWDMFVHKLTQSTSQPYVLSDRPVQPEEVAVYRIFPVPAAQVLNVASDHNDAVYSVEVISIDGRSVIKTATDHGHSLDVSGLYSGIYLVKIIEGDQVTCIRFLKQ